MVGPHEAAGEIVLYRTDDGRTRVECRSAEETLWLSQALMAEGAREVRRAVKLQTTSQNISLHLKARYSRRTCKCSLQVAASSISPSDAAVAGT